MKSIQKLDPFNLHIRAEYDLSMSVEETQFVKPLEVVTRINPADGPRTATHSERLRLCAATEIAYTFQQFTTANPSGGEKYIVTINQIPHRVHPINIDPFR